jgi:hypothetical protein
VQYRLIAYYHKEHSGVHSRQPLFLTRIEYMLHATAVLKWVASQIKDFPNVVGLQLLNEPYPDKQDVINPWCKPWFAAFFPDNKPTLFSHGETDETTIRQLKPILGDDFPFYIFGNNKGRSDWIKNQTEFMVMDFHLVSAALLQLHIWYREPYNPALQYFLWNPEIEKLNTDELIARMHSYYAPLLDSWGPNLIVRRGQSGPPFT